MRYFIAVLGIAGIVVSFLALAAHYGVPVSKPTFYARTQSGIPPM